MDAWALWSIGLVVGPVVWAKYLIWCLNAPNAGPPYPVMPWY